MERLTKRDTDGQAMMDCEKCEADWTGKLCAGDAVQGL